MFSVNNKLALFKDRKIFQRTKICVKSKILCEEHNVNFNHYKYDEQVRYNVSPQKI